MTLLTSNGWEYIGKGCSCAGSPPMYKKGNFKVIIIRNKSFKFYEGAKMKFHKLIAELEASIQGI